MSEPLTVEQWRVLRGDEFVSALLRAEWFAMPDDLIGGWCVMPAEQPPSSGLPSVGDFLDERVARHVAQLHNRYLPMHEELARADAAVAEDAEFAELGTTDAEFERQAADAEPVDPVPYGWLSVDGGEWTAVSEAEWVAAERAAGLVGVPATGGFGAPVGDTWVRGRLGKRKPSEFGGSGG